ncbi:MAG: ABC transporter ATP-binding protein [Pseudomonadota bacterium]
MTAGQALLELSGIEKSFHRVGAPPVHAVKAVDLVVGCGETVALVGESGSGKSTLGRIALCLLRPDAGTVRLAGQVLSDLPQARLRQARIAMQPIFQDPSGSFNPRRTVLELLGQALQLRQVADIPGVAIRLLEDVGLRPAPMLLSRLPHELSGGQRQRLAIARALAMDPMLIIADEPLSGADVSIRGQLLNLLGDLQARRGVAYLMITHDISIARSFAHRVAVMMNGEIVETGPAADVLSRPTHAYTRRLLAAVPTLRRGPSSDRQSDQATGAS